MLRHLRPGEVDHNYPIDAESVAIGFSDHLDLMVGYGCLKSKFPLPYQIVSKPPTLYSGKHPACPQFPFDRHLGLSRIDGIDRGWRVCDDLTVLRQNNESARYA